MELIINNENKLRLPCEVVSLQEGRELARKITTWIERNNKKARKPLTLAELKTDSQGKVWKNPDRPMYAVGLAAPQLGIYKKVVVATIRGRLIPLINPRIVSASHVFIPWTEMCMSFPGKKVDTFRRSWVEVQCDNWPAIERIGPKSPDDWNEKDLQESVCVQHEIAHVYSKLMDDFTTPNTECPSRW
jgi:peptide deformylase